MHNAKKYLKNFDEVYLSKLFQISDLTDIEYWVLHYGFIKKRMVLNTCAKLNISESTYRNIYNNALTKVDMTFKNLLDIKN